MRAYRAERKNGAVDMSAAKCSDRRRCADRAVAALRWADGDFSRAPRGVAARRNGVSYSPLTSATSRSIDMFHPVSLSASETPDGMSSCVATSSVPRFTPPACVDLGTGFACTVMACDAPAAMALLLHGHWLRAAFCLGLQLSVIGWIPAAIWAVLIVKEDQAQRRYRSIVSRARG